MLSCGMATRQVARHFKYDHSTIVRLNHRFLATGTTDDRHRPGQPRVTTPALDRQIRLTHQRNRFQTATQTAAVTPGTRGIISTSTVRRRLRTYGLQNRRPYTGAILTRRHRMNRLPWAQQFIHCPRAEWRSTMFYYESRFNVSFADRRVRVWRRPGERYTNACVAQHNRYGRGSIHVWDGFSYHHRTPLHVFRVNVTADVYVNQKLRPIVVPFFQNHPDVATFQHDNARPHTANVTRNFLAQQSFRVLDWPSSSPDMNPIEHAWNELNRKVRRHHINNVIDLEQTLVAEWHLMPQEFFQTLCNSMRSRCQVCIDVAGGHTRF